MPGVSPSTIPLPWTTPRQTSLIDSGQSAAGVHPTAFDISFLEPHQELQTNAEPTIRAHLRTQRHLIKCSHCNKGFSRLDVLSRHIKEQHAERKEEFLCSNMGCVRSQKDHGFKRREKLKRHENGLCKIWIRAASPDQSAASTSPMAVSTIGDTPNAHLIHEESSPAARIDDTIISGSIALQNQDLILNLQRRSQAEEEALQIKRKECQDGRECLTNLQTVIELYERESLSDLDVILELQRCCQGKEEVLSIKERECQEMHKNLTSLHAVIQLYQGLGTTIST